MIAPTTEETTMQRQALVLLCLLALSCVASSCAFFGELPEGARGAVEKHMNRLGVPSSHYKILSADRVKRYHEEEWQHYDESWCVTVNATKANDHYFAHRRGQSWGIVAAVSESEFVRAGCSNW